MPFFGSSKKHDDNTAVAGMDNACAGGRHHVQPTIYSARLRGAGMANGDAFGQTRASAPGPIHDKKSAGNSAQDDPYTAGGVGSGRQGSDGRGIQSAGANNHGAAQNLSGDQGSGGRLAGNLEPAAPMVGSEQLKWKRLQKEQAANVFRLRSALAEAESIEHDALMCREHAAAHGAHPEHSALGIGNPGAGAGHGSGGCSTVELSPESIGVLMEYATLI